MRLCMNYAIMNIGTCFCNFLFVIIMFEITDCSHCIRCTTEKFSCTFKLFPEGWECNIHEYCCYINDYNNVVLTEDSCQHHLSMYTMLYTSSSSSSSDVDNSIREVTTV